MLTERGPLIEAAGASLESLRQLAYSDPQAFPVLLDSSAPGPLGRYCILAAYPDACLWLGADGRLHAEGLAPAAGGVDSDGFLQALQGAWRSAATEQLRRAGHSPSAASVSSVSPFLGGWMVFAGYELASEIEPQLQLPRAAGEEGAGPVALALRVPAALVFDQTSGEAWCIAEPGRSELIEALHAALKRAPLATALSPQALRHAPLPPLQLLEEAPERFATRVKAALEYIRAGDIYQANLSRPWRGRFEGAEAARGTDQWLVAALYERLRAANPAPFAALVQHRGWRLLSSSPERLVQAAAGEVQTRPIAGTRPRSRQSGQDAHELAALIAHPKERAEHVMLVDLERNDLGRICQAGSVRADPMMFTESYAHVHHIVSNVSGRLRAGITPIDVLRAVFPGGTITGCPKYRCMQVIAELEGEARGAYTGAIGYINHDGSMDFNILIRTLTLSGRQLAFRAGGGIVADSNWQRELEETRAKARGLLAALQDPVLA